MSAPLPTRALGSLVVPAVGYGAMVLAGTYARADDTDASRALGAALDAGCTFVDTSDSYGANERQIGTFLAGRRRDELQISTKFGLRALDGEPMHRLPVPWSMGEFRINAEPRLVRAHLERSLRHLGTDFVDVYSPHFPDPEVPIEDTVGAMVPLVEDGLVRHLGLSNPTLDHLVRAQTVHRIAAVQVEWSMWHPLEPGLLAHCERTEVGIVAWSPVGRGFLTGTLTAVDEGDFRAHVERFTGPNLAANGSRRCVSSRPSSASPRSSSPSPGCCTRARPWCPFPGAVRRPTSPRTHPRPGWCSTRPPSLGSTLRWRRSCPPALCPEAVHGVVRKLRRGPPAEIRTVAPRSPEMHVRSGGTPVRSYEPTASQGMVC